MSTDPAPNFDARAMLAAAWPLFQQSWAGCLPLAVVGVAASGSPRAAARAAGEPSGLIHTGEWWGLYVAVTALVLICHGGVMLRQLALAQGATLTPFEAMRLAARRLPGSAATAIVLFAPLAAAAALAPRGAAVVVPLLVLGAGLATWLAFAWPVALAEGEGPATALRRGAQLVRGRFAQVALLVGIAFAAVIVFVMLTGIFLGIVMSIAGMGGPLGPLGLTASRLLIALLLGVAVVWLGAVWVTAYRALGGRFDPGSR